MWIRRDIIVLYGFSNIENALSEIKSQTPTGVKADYNAKEEEEEE